MAPCAGISIVPAHDPDAGRSSLTATSSTPDGRLIAPSQRPLADGAGACAATASGASRSRQRLMNIRTMRISRQCNAPRPAREGRSSRKSQRAHAGLAIATILGRAIAHRAHRLGTRRRRRAGALPRPLTARIGRHGAGLSGRGRSAGPPARVESALAARRARRGTAPPLRARGAHDFGPQSSQHPHGLRRRPRRRHAVPRDRVHRRRHAAGGRSIAAASTPGRRSRLPSRLRRRSRPRTTQASSIAT